MWQPCLICYTANFLPKRGRRRAKSEKGKSKRGEETAPGKARRLTKGQGESGSPRGEADATTRHRQWGAVCLETVNFIGSLRFKKQLPSMLLLPGGEYYHKTMHRFSTVNGELQGAKL